jgi:hypothetical protein
MLSSFRYLALRAGGKVLGQQSKRNTSIYRGLVLLPSSALKNLYTTF